MSHQLGSLAERGSDGLLIRVLGQGRFDTCTARQIRSETKLVMTLLRPSPDGCALASRRTDVPCYTGPSLKPGISQLEAAQEGTSYLSRYSDSVNVLTKIISVHGYMRAINTYSAFRKA